MKIFCVGRNYAEHAKELNNEVPQTPVIFMKPNTAICKSGNWYYPEFSKDIHYEAEIVLKIKKSGKHIAEKFAANYIESIGLGIDFTARDVQQELKAKGLPWELAKAFDNAALISEKWINFEDFKGKNIIFSLRKNNETVQLGNTGDLIFTFEQLISFLSTHFTLNTGDLIFTGTPKGVGAISIGDVLTGFIEEEEMFNISIK